MCINTNNKVNQVVNQVQALLPEVKEIISNRQGFKELTEVLNKLHSSCERIYKDHINILICGLTKSGKSTLINLLTNSKRNISVSPTERGVECTIIPSVICKGTRDYINYYSGALISEDAKSRFIGIFDYHKGISSDVNIKPDAVKSGPLTPGYLANLTAKNYDKKSMENGDIAFIEVEVKEDSLLNKLNISIIDSPGLDGCKAGYQNNPVQEWLKEEADLVIIGHSDMAAVNTELYRYLASFNEKCPIILLYNEMENTPWREGMDIPEEESKINKITEVENNLKSTGIKLAGSTNINCKKGVDGRFYGREDLVSAAGILEFEQQLLQYILEKKRQIIERKNLGTIENKFIETYKLTNQAKQQAFAKLKKISDMKKKLESFKNNVRQINYPVNGIKDLCRDVLYIRHSPESTHKMSVYQEFEIFALKYAEILSGSGDAATSSEFFKPIIHRTLLGTISTSDALNQLDEFIHSKIWTILNNSNLYAKMQEKAESIVDAAENNFFTQIIESLTEEEIALYNLTSFNQQNFSGVDQSWVPQIVTNYDKVDLGTFLKSDKLIQAMGNVVKKKMNRIKYIFEKYVDDLNQAFINLNNSRARRLEGALDDLISKFDNATSFQKSECEKTIQAAEQIENMIHEPLQAVKAAISNNN